MHTTVAEWIKTRFETGITLEPRVIAYIKSTFGILTFNDLTESLKNSDDPEIDSLKLLLFSPAQALQIELEPLISGYHFSIEDETAIAGHIADRCPKIRFTTPGNKKKHFFADLSHELARHFVNRLHIRKIINRGLRRSLDEALPPPYALEAGVIIRNSPCLVDETSVQWLIRWITQTQDSGPNFLNTLNFLLNFIAFLPDEATLLNRLAAFKAMHLKILNRVLRHADPANRTTMEERIMAGIPMPAESVEYLQHRIEMVDRIAVAMFGRIMISDG